MSRRQILEDAIKCVCGDRDQQYGSPENSFEAIALMWNAYLQSQCSGPLEARDVAAMMILFKVGRIVTGQSKADNWIDIAGYAACGGEVEGR